MKNLRTNVILNVVGLVLSGLGFAMLIAAFPRSGRLLAAVLLSGGLLLIAASSLRLLARRKMTGGEPGSAAELSRGLSMVSIANRDQLATALQNLRDRA